MSSTFLHNNKGVKALAYTVRTNREIRKVLKTPDNFVHKDGEETFLVTVGDCERAKQYARIKLVPYVGNWPRLQLVWKRVKEIVND